MGAAHLAERPAGRLSGGEARRVHLARALAVEPDVLLLDEPFAGLDANARADLLYETAGELRSPERATLVVVHDRAEAWALADRVVVLLDGTAAASGSPREVFERPATPEVARFVGFSGRVLDSEGVLLLRAADVALDPDGPLRGTVARAAPLEEGTRLEIELEDGAGRLVAIGPVPSPAPGETVRARVTGGVRFPGGGAS
jgi:ABC-type sulfate/molybdate transport systems ATPase subunit